MHTIFRIVRTQSALLCAIQSAVERCSVFDDCVAVQYDSGVMRFRRNTATNDIDVVADLPLFSVQHDRRVAVASEAS
jgi:hypothetical protein